MIQAVLAPHSPMIQAVLTPQEDIAIDSTSQATGITGLALSDAPTPPVGEAITYGPPIRPIENAPVDFRALAEQLEQRLSQNQVTHDTAIQKGEPREP